MGVSREQVIEVSSDPAAGAEISYTVGEGEIWDLLAVHFSLVTDANVGSRAVQLIIDDGTNIVCQTPPYIEQTESVTGVYSAFPGATIVGSGAALVGTFAIPRLTLFPGWRVRTSTVGIQAGDNFGVMRLLVSPA